MNKILLVTLSVVCVAGLVAASVFGVLYFDSQKQVTQLAMWNTQLTNEVTQLTLNVTTLDHYYGVATSQISNLTSTLNDTRIALDSTYVSAENLYNAMMLMANGSRVTLDSTWHPSSNETTLLNATCINSVNNTLTVTQWPIHLFVYHNDTNLAAVVCFINENVTSPAFIIPGNP